MELVKVTSSSDPLLAQVPFLYESAFPPIARICTQGLLELVEEHPAMTFNAITDNGSFCGMAVTWDLGDCRYLEYFAVLPSMRNKGIGAQALAALKGQSATPIVGEAELPVLDIQKRRIAFYLRNGFLVVSDNPSILNGYHSDNLLCLLSTSPLDDAEECQRQIIDKVYRVMQAKDALLTH